MSYTTVYAFINGKNEEAEELRNSWGSAAMVWEALATKYRITDGPTFEQSDRKWVRLWKAEETGAIKLLPWERIVLHSTYDKALVRGADLERFAEACDRFYEAHSVPSIVCHVGKFARLARAAKANGADALGFNQTSVSESHWTVRPDDPDDERRPYDLAVDTDHWFIDCAPDSDAEGRSHG